MRLRPPLSTVTGIQLCHAGQPRSTSCPVINDLVAGGNGVFGVGTARRTTVPVILDVVALSRTA
ncbi:hypothetical protein ACWEOE_26695 [Amycolatopsis sp. NPDC004368]